MISAASQFDAAVVADHYDELDVFYRELWGEHVHHGLWINGQESPDVAVRHLVDVVAKEAQIKPGDHVIITGNPGRNPEDHRLRMRSIKRPSDGFGWSGVVQ